MTTAPLVVTPGRVLRSRRARLSLRVHPRALGVGCALVAAIAVVGVVTLGTGDYPVPLADVVRALVGRGDEMTGFIVVTLRLPRLLTALLVGCALGASGAIFQSLSRNPLGSPDILGFDTGAASGALVAILVLHSGAFATAGGALAGGFATAAIVYLLAYKRGVHGYRLVLVGIGVGAMLASVNAYLMTRATREEALGATAWLLGSLNGVGWEHVVPVALALAILLPTTLFLGRSLALLELGDDAAHALGIRVERDRLLLVVAAVALAAVATAATGPVVFIALAAPQVARRLTRSAQPGLVTAALTGALLLALSDLAAQRLFPEQLPVGVMTGAVGGLYLVWLLSREWRSGRA